MSRISHGPLPDRPLTPVGASPSTPPAATSASSLASQAYDTLAATYDLAFCRPIDQAENVVAHGLLRARGFDEGRLLDLGCGTGLLLDYLGLPPERYIGVDISQGMLQQAREKRPNYTFLHGDMLAPPPTGPFQSVVSMFGSAAYVPDTAALLSAVYHLLVPGGALCLHLLGERYHTRQPHIINANVIPAPVRQHAPDQAVALARAAGFSHIEVVGLNWLGDKLPSWVSPRLARLYLRLETATVGRLWPSRGYYLLLFAQRPEA